MLYGLIQLSWFEATTAALPFITVALLQLLNVFLTDQTARKVKAASELSSASNLLAEDGTTPTKTTTKTTAAATNGKTTAANSAANGKLQKQKSEYCEDHEDEDTLSLENLFPCDQSEIYASKKISFIIDELIQTEANYVNNLSKGLKNYGELDARADAPDALKGADNRQRLLGNVEDILALHEQQILPLMLRNQRDLKALFDEFSVFFDNVQNQINDKLGIDSFLVQPVQRLTRYPLLLQQFISEFYKSGISCKPVLASVCKLETRMRRLLEVVNQAEEVAAIDELAELNLPAQGYFRRATEFEAYHHRSRKKYTAKVFLFDRCLICTEVRKRRLAYRHHYAWPTLELQLNGSKSITVLLRGSGAASAASGAKEEYEFTAQEASAVTQWIRCARKIIEIERVEAAMRGKFSLPMDLVLGVGIAIWLIWNYLP
ncbi:PREDICTED: rho guanine nucleotide exchange factor 25 isoform X2 [Rhagoletis zephyria]|uniref:rho guanine nucleotide exchange factor 25 isoform X2 n=1 Tax=Rhagoletis zephyria TaxID=28612 RepID=UPI000811770B|nr:PREDICTED: rho guanine nucleotide exchange factor 25 isoform X2 [Rhagoletis zephyria]